MKVVFLSLAVLALCVAPALAHNWLQAPPSRNGNTDAQTNLACPDPADGRGSVDEPDIVVAKGGYIDVMWTANGGGGFHSGPHYVVMDTLANEDTLDDIDAPGEGLFYKEYLYETRTENITIDNTWAVGKYVLQYRWKTYKNCVTVEIVQGAATQPDRALVPNSVDCQGYCTDFMNVCDDLTAGTEYAFDSYDHCLAQCARYPTDGEFADVQGNTFQCREYHLHVEGGDMSVHCPHASFTGFNEQHCQGGDYVPAISVKLTATSTDAVKSEIEGGVRASLLAQGVDADSITAVTVHQALNADEYVVNVQFVQTSTGEAHMASLLSDPSGFMEGMALTGDYTVEVANSGSTQTVPRGSNAGLGGHGIAAAVMLSIVVVAAFVIAFVFHERIADNTARFLNFNGRYLFGALAFTGLVGFIFWIVAFATTQWVQSPTFTMGLFHVCLTGQSCEVIYDFFSAESFALVEAATVCAFVSFTATIVMIAIPAMTLSGKVPLCLDDERLAMFQFVAHVVASLTSFLCFCLYAAFYNDEVVSDTTNLGWSFGLVMLFWLVSLPCMLIAYRLRKVAESGADFATKTAAANRAGGIEFSTAV